MSLTKDQLKNLKVGQQLFYENGQGKHHWDGYNITIKKIGNKFAYAGVHKISLEDGRIVSNYSTVKVWFSEQDFIAQHNLNEAWVGFKALVSRFYVSPPHLTIEDIQQLSDRIKPEINQHDPK